MERHTVEKSAGVKHKKKKKLREEGQRGRLKIKGIKVKEDRSEIGVMEEGGETYCGEKCSFET